MPSSIALCKQQNNSKQRKNYWQRNNNDGGELHYAGTLAGTLIIAREHRDNTKQASNPGMTCKLA